MPDNSPVGQQNSYTAISVRRINPPNLGPAYVLWIGNCGPAVNYPPDLNSEESSRWVRHEAPHCVGRPHDGALNRSSKQATLDGTAERCAEQQTAISDATLTHRAELWLHSSRNT